MAEKIQMILAILDGVTGTAGAVLANALVYPLLTISTRLQVDSRSNEEQEAQKAKSTPKDLVATVTDLYAGLSSALFGVAVSNGVYHYWYSLLRSFYGADKKPLSNLMNLLVAAEAGAINVVLTNPIWVVNTRLVTGHKTNKSLLGLLLEILNTEGLSALYKGVIPALILVANPAVQFMVYERLLDILSKGRSIDLKGYQIFLVGAISKLAATGVTYPYLVVKSRLQEDKEHKYKGTLDAVQKILKNEGLVGFYKGIRPKLLHSVLCAALLLWIKEWLMSNAFKLAMRLRQRALAAK